MFDGPELEGPLAMEPLDALGRRASQFFLLKVSELFGYGGIDELVEARRPPFDRSVPLLSAPMALAEVGICLR